MKVWFDISGLYNWRGSFTGIQRIVYNLAVELDKSDMNTGFFIYHYGSFAEVGITTLEQRLKELNMTNDKNDKIHHRKNISLAAIQHHSILALKNMVRNTRFEPLLRSAYIRPRRIYRNLRGLKYHKQSDMFKNGDIVIVVDGNWQFSGYAQSLGSAKLRYNFKLVHFVHDLVAIKNPALASPGADKRIVRYFKTVFSIADMLVTISDSTKRDTGWFIEKFRIKNQPIIKTLIMGDNMSTSTIKTAKPSIDIPSDFILVVSTIEIRKNYTSLYYAYNQ